ncbi:hypothetical protein J7L87_04000 [bacterium]|nr:hypothetical protein [bacterium]
MKRILKFSFVPFLLVSFLTFSAEKFGYRISKDKDVFLYTQGNIYLVQPQCIISSGNMLYFAAQDFTAKKELLVKKTKKVEVIKDEEEKKIIKTTFILGDNKRDYPDYELILFLEIRKNFPFLAIYSKFAYNGKERHLCGINWGLESAYTPYKYYTIPKKGKILTFKLKKTRKTKIGHANWIFANTGKGTGAGLIAPAVILGRGENFIFINSVPPKKRIKKGETIDVFMIFLPIDKNFKILEKLYNEVKNIEWKY